MQKPKKPKIIVICGPTGIGKTALSLMLAEKFNGRIIGADSMQIYKFMDIGTAKPSPEERRRIPHYMIDIVDPDESYDAARYARESRDAISDSYGQGKIPFVVGGTGFYIKALLYGLCEAAPGSLSVRQELRQEAELSGSKTIYDRLLVCDPEAAARIHPNDTYRVIRALEIYEIAGIPMSQYQRLHGFKTQPFNALKIGLTIDRDALYKRIDRRVDRMISEGLLDEVNMLLQMGYTGVLKSMQSIGYQHMVTYLDGIMGWDETVSTLKRDTRKYAKRQLTWFKKDREINWKLPDDQEGITAMVEGFLHEKNRMGCA